MSTTRSLALALAGLLLAGWATCSACTPTSGGTGPSGARPADDDDPPQDERKAKLYGYRIVERYPHDVHAYTQGLLWRDGHLYETTGRLGTSTLRRVELKTGKVLQQASLPGDLFGEGLARWKGVFIQLTWQDGVAIVWDAKTFQELYRHEYQGEGWGLTVAGEELVMSDGTSRLQIRDPKTFELERRVDVTMWNPVKERYEPVDSINELEWIEGEIWANVYQYETIVRIDLETGHVTSLIDFSGLQAVQRVKDRNQDVQNGIAHDPATGRLFITGKYWPNLYQIELVDEE